MTIDSTRRGFLFGLGALVAAPAIVKAEILMPVRGIIMPVVGGPLPLDLSFEIEKITVTAPSRRLLAQYTMEIVYPGYYR